MISRPDSPNFRVGGWIAASSQAYRRRVGKGPGYTEGSLAQTATATATSTTVESDYSSAAAPNGLPSQHAESETFNQPLRR